MRREGVGAAVILGVEHATGRGVHDNEYAHVGFLGLHGPDEVTDELRPDCPNARHRDEHTAEVALRSVGNRPTSRMPGSWPASNWAER